MVSVNQQNNYIHCFVRGEQVGTPVQSSFKSFYFTPVAGLARSTKVVAVTELDHHFSPFLVQDTPTARRELCVQVVTGGIFLNPRIEILAICTAIVLQIPDFPSVLYTARILKRVAGVSMFGIRKNDE